MYSVSKISLIVVADMHSHSHVVVSHFNCPEHTSKSPQTEATWCDNN